jgi:hypothetical protein
VAVKSGSELFVEMNENPECSHKGVWLTLLCLSQALLETIKCVLFQINILPESPYSVLLRQDSLSGKECIRVL